jgi:hypothetical protein
MRQAPFKAGDVVEIRTLTGKIVIGWVVYVSDYFNDLLGVLVYEGKKIRLESLPEMKPLVETIYTSGNAAKHYGWKQIGHFKPDASIINRTKRIVGGEVYVGDDCISAASEQDRYTLPKMLVKGMPIVFDELERL